MAGIKRTTADIWFSRAIRERAGWTCERCHRQYPENAAGLECAHWHSRGSWSVRFDASNALSLCTGCHFQTSMHRDEEHRPLMLKIVGEMELDRLAYDKSRPANGIKRQVSEIAKHYRQEVSRLRSMREAGYVGRLDLNGWTP